MLAGHGEGFGGFHGGGDDAGRGFEVFWGELVCGFVEEGEEEEGLGEAHDPGDAQKQSDAEDHGEGESDAAGFVFRGRRGV